jgi:hypothetical protein
MAVTLPEPDATRRLRSHLDEVRGRLSEAQRIAIDEWNQPRGLDAAVLLRLRKTVDASSLDRLAKRLAYRAKRIAHHVDHASDVRDLMEQAVERPAAVSAILWRLNGANNAALTSHLIQIVRERAGLPALQRPIESTEPTMIDEIPQLAWFADRQLADACAWMENVAPPTNGTLVEISEALARERGRARRIPIATLVPFVQRAASLFLHLSTRNKDPLGIPLKTDAQLDVDPSIDRRLGLTRWARGAGHAICPRGHMLTLTIPIQATSPNAVQLIAAELGHGACGGLGFLLRLLGPVEAPCLSPAPIMLCLPDEDLDERGARFERWLGASYPHATQAWRPWS